MADDSEFSRKELIDAINRNIDEIPEGGEVRMEWLESLFFDRLRFRALIIMVVGFAPDSEEASPLPDLKEDSGVVFQEIGRFFSREELKAVLERGLKGLAYDRFVKLWQSPRTLVRLSRFIENSNSSYWLPLIREQSDSR